MTRIAFIFNELNTALLSEAVRTPNSFVKMTHRSDRVVESFLYRAADDSFSSALAVWDEFYPEPFRELCLAAAENGAEKPNIFVVIKTIPENHAIPWLADDFIYQEEDFGCFDRCLPLRPESGPSFYLIVGKMLDISCAEDQHRLRRPCGYDCCICDEHASLEKNEANLGLAGGAAPSPGPQRGTPGLAGGAAPEPELPENAIGASGASGVGSEYSGPAGPRGTEAE